MSDALSNLQTNRSTTPDPALVYASIYAASVTIHPIDNRSDLAVLSKEKRLYRNDTSLRFTYPIDDKVEGWHYSSLSHHRHLTFKFEEEECHVPMYSYHQLTIRDYTAANRHDIHLLFMH